MLKLDRQSRQPLYRQILEHFKNEIGNGRLPPNSRLPTVRSLARELGVTRLTIQNAYSELQADGWVEATVGRGTFVSSSVQAYKLEPTVGQYLTADNAINDMLKINQVVGVRSMAMASPDTTRYPVEQFWQSLEKVRYQNKTLFGYGSVQGDMHLRIEIVCMLQNRGVRYFYTIANFHNPTGICMSAKHRHAILELARKYDVVIIEDDIYGHLSFDKEPPPPLKVLDQDQRVIYLGGFSKMLLPSLRVGFIIIPPPFKADLLAMRRSFDLCGPPFLQRALALFLADGQLKPHLKRMRPVYHERCQTLMRALQNEMPSFVRWIKPKGGFCCWVSMPRQFEPGELYRLALQHGVAFTPGEAHEMRESDQEHFRLCYGNLPATGIEATIKQLAVLIKRGSQTNQWMPLV